MLQIELLGELRVVREQGELTTISSKKAAMLLAYLALQPGRMFSRESLAGLFWPGATPESGRHSLRMALSSLRLCLGDVFLGNPQQIGLSAAQVVTDVQAFEAALRDEQWAEAVALYKGPLVPQCYEGWVLPQQVRLADLFAVAVSHWADEAEEPHHARERISRALTVDPHNVELGALLERWRRPQHPMPLTVGRAVSVLPQRMTRFIGRDAERSQLCEKLAPDSPQWLVVLTGPGGSGKTRMGGELARELRALYPEGLYFVSLLDLHDETMLWERLRRLLGVADGAGKDSPRLIAEVLSLVPQALLILDNAEHLRAATVQVVSTLREQVPQVRFLVISRHRLRMEGEWEQPLFPLPLMDAMTLFEDRARRARPDFQLSSINRAVVMAICQQVDCLPLAVEIVAARIAILSPTELLAQLDQCLDFPVHGEQSPRHRSLRGVIHASYALLTPALQTIFQELVVFRNGWTLEDAQAVLEAPNLATALEELLAHSLIHYEGSADASRVRFGMLETIAAFAREQLAPERLEALQKRHAAYFYEHGSSPQASLEIEAAQPNFLAALDWFHHHDPVSAATMVSALSESWLRADLLIEGRRQLELCLKSEDALSKEARGVLWYRLGAYCEELGELPEAQGALERSLALLQESPESSARSWAHYSLGTTLIRRALYAHAEDQTQEARRLWQEQGHRVGVALAHGNLAQIARHRGLIGEAAVLAEEALVEEDPWWRASTYATLGAIRCRQGRTQEAFRLLTESAQLYQELRCSIRWAQVLRYRAAAALCAQEFVRAEADCEQAEQLYRRIGVARGVALTRMLRAELALYQNDLVTATRYLEQIQPPKTVADDADFLLLAGRLALRRGELTAPRLLQEALRLFTHQELLLGQVEALEALAEACPEQTATWWASALPQRARLGAPLPLVELTRRASRYPAALPSVRAPWEEILKAALNLDVL